MPSPLPPSHAPTSPTPSQQDIHKPDPARLRRHLSAVVNFAKFREEKLVAYAELQARAEALAEQKRAADAAAAARAEELEVARAARAGEEAEAARVQAEADALRAANQQLNKQFAAAAGEVKALKAAAAQLSEAVQAEKFELVAAQQENERLREQVVASPEKFQKSLAEMQAAVDGERAGVDAADKRCRALQARGDTVGKVGRDVEKCLELMREIENEVRAAPLDGGWLGGWCWLGGGLGPGGWWLEGGGWQ